MNRPTLPDSAPAIHLHSDRLRMFCSYAERYDDWVARGKPPSPSLPTHWVWKSNGKVRHRPLIEALAEAQGGGCSLCGKPLTKMDRTIEHVVPRSLGGGNHRNKLAAHGTCNRLKGASMPTGCELILLDAVNTRLFA
jgi:5-methylcytosine-specific restriction endonuclease McrA